MENLSPAQPSEVQRSPVYVVCINPKNFCMQARRQLVHIFRAQCSLHICNQRVCPRIGSAWEGIWRWPDRSLKLSLLWRAGRSRGRRDRWRTCGRRCSSWLRQERLRSERPECTAPSSSPPTPLHIDLLHLLPKQHSE